MMVALFLLEQQVIKKFRFNSKEEWAAYAVQVAKSQGGYVYINHYAWKQGKDLRNAVRHAVDLKLMKDCGGKRNNRIYKVI